MGSQITNYVGSLALISLGIYMLYKSVRPKKGEELLHDTQIQMQTI
jgi:putative Mn2+ efflux pump MntP